MSDESIEITVNITLEQFEDGTWDQEGGTEPPDAGDVADFLEALLQTSYALPWTGHAEVVES